MGQHFPILSIVSLFLGAFIIAALGKSNKLIRNIIMTLSGIISFSMVIYLGKAVVINNKIINYWLGGWEPIKEFAIGIGLEVDGLSWFFGVIVVITMLLTIIASYGYLKRVKSASKYSCLFLIFSGSVLGMIFSSDLLNLFIITQVSVISMSALISFEGENETSYQRGLRFLISGALGGLFIILGVVLLYIQFHTLNIPQISVMLHNNFTPVTLFAFAALLGGFVVNVGLFPIHMPMVEAMQGSSIPSAIMLKGMLSTASLYIVIRLVFTIYTSMEIRSMRYLFIVCGSIMMILLAIIALRELNIKKSIIYEIFSELGLVVFAMGLGTINGNVGGFYHLLNQTLFFTLLILCIGIIEKLTGTASIHQLGGLLRKIPGVFIAFCIGAFSLIGLPPFGGFISRWIVLKNCLESGLWFLGIIIVLAAIISTINILRIILGTFGGEVPAEYDKLEKLTIRGSLPMWITSMVCLILGLCPYYITKYLVNPAVSALYDIEKYVDGAMGTGFALKWLGEQEAMKSISFIEKGFYSPMACLVGYIILLISIGVMSMGKANSSLQSARPEDEKKNTFGFVEKGIKYLQKINDDLINEYSLVIVSITAILLVFMFIFV